MCPGPRAKIHRRSIKSIVNGFVSWASGAADSIVVTMRPETCPERIEHFNQSFFTPVGLPAVRSPESRLDGQLVVERCSTLNQLHGHVFKCILNPLVPSSVNEVHIDGPKASRASIAHGAFDIWLGDYGQCQELVIKTLGPRLRRLPASIVRAFHHLWVTFDGHLACDRKPTVRPRLNGSNIGWPNTGRPPTEINLTAVGKLPIASVRSDNSASTAARYRSVRRCGAVIKVQ